MYSNGCMLSTSIQILKAIHNLVTEDKRFDLLYVIYFDTNFESYSQHRDLHGQRRRRCMLSTSIQILKAIHNNPRSAPVTSELYVIYFDTNFESYSQHGFVFGFRFVSCMLSTSIQILKAIHNQPFIVTGSTSVVCYLLRYKF